MRETDPSFIEEVCSVCAPIRFAHHHHMSQLLKAPEEPVGLTSSTKSQSVEAKGGCVLPVHLCDMIAISRRLQAHPARGRLSRHVCRQRGAL